MKRRIHILLILAIIGLTLSSCKNGEETKTKQPPQDEFRISFHQAIQEKMRGNYDVAAELFEKCLSYDDNSDAVHYALSDIYQLLDEPNKPLEHAVRAYEIDAENRWYQLRLADLYYSAGNYHKSAEYFEMAIADEKNLDVKFRYAETLIYSHDYEKAIEVMNDIEVETGLSAQLSLTKHDLYLQLGNPEAAQHELDHFIEDDPLNMENRMIIADYFLNTSQPEKAEKIANEALLLAPEYGEVRLILADIAIRKGDLDKCFEHLAIGFKQDDVSLNRKVSLIGNLQIYAFEDTDDGRKIQDALGNLYQIIYTEEEQNDTLHSQYGNFLMGQNKPIEAIVQFQLVVNSNPNSYDSWMQLLYSQYDIDEYEGMLKNGKEAVELFPAQPTIFMLASIAAIERGDYQNAEEWLHYGKGLVVKDDKLSSEFEHQQGVLSWKQKDYKQAHTYFDQALATDQFNGNVFYSRALCYVDQKEDDKAMAEVEKALELAPTSPFFHDLKGLVFFKTGKYEEARKSFISALAYENTNPKTLEHYGDALFQLGEMEAAIEQWQLAKDNGGYNAVLIKKLADKKYYEQ